MFPNLFCLRRPYLVLQVFGGTRSWFNRYNIAHYHNFWIIYSNICFPISSKIFHWGFKVRFFVVPFTQEIFVFLLNIKQIPILQANTSTWVKFGLNRKKGNTWELITDFCRVKVIFVCSFFVTCNKSPIFNFVSICLVSLT